MNCKFAFHIPINYTRCLLRKYNSRPNPSECHECMQRGENTPEFAAPLPTTQPPPLLTQARTALGAAGRFLASGFAPTPPDILAEREATCRACPEWDAEALNATGRCRKCGCLTWAKIRMATEACPLGKWQAVPLTAPAE